MDWIEKIGVSAIESIEVKNGHLGGRKTDKP
jgi:hypothetical protein